MANGWRRGMGAERDVVSIMDDKERSELVRKTFDQAFETLKRTEGEVPPPAAPRSDVQRRIDRIRVNRSGQGMRHSKPIERQPEYQEPEQDWSGWNRWLDGKITEREKIIIQALGEV